jgi:outer membrane protein assembly factor BamB
MEKSALRGACRFASAAKSWTVLILAVSTTVVGQIHAQSGLGNSSWPAFRHDSRLTARAAVNGPVIPEITWISKIGAGQLGSPAIGPDGTIYVPGNVDDDLYAIAPNGQLKWIFHATVVVPDDPFVAAPIVGSDGVIYIGTTTNVFYAVNPDGTERWHVLLDGAIEHSANIDHDGTIYVVAQDCRLYAIAPDGTIKWRRDLQGFPMNAPAIAAFSWIFVVAGEFLEAYRSDGTRQWLFKHDGMGEIHGLIADDDTKNIYITSRNRQQVRAIKKSSGATAWTFSLPAEFGSPSLPALSDDGAIYFTGSKGGRLFALNNNGKERWTFTLPDTNYLTAPVLDDSNHVYIVTDSQGLISISAEGKLRWSLPEVRCNFSPAFGANGTIYVASDKKVYAVGPQPARADMLEKDAGDVQTGCIDSTLANPIRALVRDQYLKPFPGQKVGFRVISGGGSVSDNMVTTGNDGIAQVFWTLGSFVGVQEVEVTSEGSHGPLKGSPLVFTATATAPQISGEPEMVFDTTAAKQASEKIYAIHNNSGCTLRIDSLRILDDAHASFFVLDTVRDSLIASEDSLEVRIQFAPTVFGNHQATLRIFNNDSDQSEFEVILRGVAVGAPQVAVQPDSLIDFGEVFVGDSATRTLTIFNVGTANLLINSFQIAGANANEFGFVSGNRAVSIPPAGSHVLTLSFAPSDSGLRTANLLISSNDPFTNPFSVLLRGVGVVGPDEPDIEARPLTLEFPPVCLDSANTQTLTIRNVGREALEITEFKFSDPAFSTTAGRLIIAPGDSKKVLVTFKPNEVRDYNDSLLIISNDPDESPLAVALGAKGIGAMLAIKTTPADSGEICLGQTALTEVCITNVGNCVLRIDSVRFGLFPLKSGLLKSPQFSLNRIFAAPIFLKPGEESCIFSFDATDQTSDFGVRVRVRSNAVNEDPANRIIRWKVIKPAIAAEDSVDFGEVAINTSKQDRALVWNAGKCQVRIDSVKVIGADATAFVLDAASFLKILEAGDTTAIAITFTPERTGLHTATLLVFNNDPNPQHNPLRVQLLGIGKDGEGTVPDIAVAPVTLDFGTVCRDSLLSIIVKNEGNAPLQVDSLIFTNLAFSTAHAGSFTLAPGASETIQVRFAPQTEEANGTLLIYSNDPDENPVVVQLHGQGGIPDIAADKTEVDFGAVEIQLCAGDTNSATQTYVIRNDGECDLRIENLTTSGAFSITNGRGPHIVPPGGSREVVLQFTPLTPGSYADTLRILSDDPDERELEVVLLGSGVEAPDIAVVPDTLDFGLVEIESQKDLPITVRNVGALVLRVDSLVISDPNSVFSTDAKAFTLACDEDSSVTITFAPKATIGYEATLSIWSNDPNENPVIVILRGRGKAKEAVIIVEPDPITFPAICLDEDTTFCDIKITNNGTAPLIVQNPQISPTPTFTTEAEEFMLLPGASTTICVAFSPTVPGTHRGTLTLISNAVNSPTVIELIGRGVAPHIAGQDTLVFPNTRVNSDTSRVYVALEDSLFCELVVDSLWISGANASEFRADSLTQPITIAPGGSANLTTIRFTPTATGERTAQLNLRSNDPAQKPRVVQLRGMGVTGGLVIDHPISAVACPGEASIIECTLRNEGKAYLLIKHVRIEPDSPVFRFREPIPPNTQLAAGESRIIQIIFTPNRSGQFNATLSISANLPPDIDSTVTLIGIGDAEIPRIVASPSAPDSITFKNSVLDKRTRPPRTITISNEGCVPLRISNIKLKRNSKVFIDSLAAPLPFTLGQKESMDFVYVSFQGDDFKTFRDTLCIYSNDTAQNPTLVYLVGNVKDSSSCLSINPLELNFGEVGCNQSESRDLAVTNCSNGSRLVVAVQKPNLPDYTVMPETLRVFPGNTQFFRVNFTPTETGQGERLDKIVLVYHVFDNPNEKKAVEIPLRGVATCRRVYARPNAFTPNEDGRNDSAKVHFPGYNELIAPALRIYDLRGLAVRTIARSNRNEFVIGWDGYDESRRLMLPGVYLWLLEDNGKKVGSGQIVLIR